jgi:hypothetical protein
LEHEIFSGLPGFTKAKEERVSEEGRETALQAVALLKFAHTNTVHYTFEQTDTHTHPPTYIHIIYIPDYGISFQAVVSSIPYLCQKELGK